MGYREKLAEITKRAKGAAGDGALDPAAFAERAIAAIAKSVDADCDEDVSGELELLAKARVQEGEDGTKSVVLEKAEAEEPKRVDLTKVAKGHLAGRAKLMKELAGELEKSEDEGAKAVAKNLMAAQAKLTSIAAALNLDPNEDGFRWKVSRALGMLKEYVELQRLLGAGGPQAMTASLKDAKKEAQKEAAQKAAWPRDLAASELDPERGVVVKGSIWGPDPDLG